MKSFERISQSRLKSYSKLTQKKYRQSDRKFLVEGVHLVEEALKSEWEVESLVVSGEWVGKENGKQISVEHRAESPAIRGINSELRAMSDERGVVSMKQILDGCEAPIYYINDMEFTKLSDTVTSQGIIAVVKIKEYATQDFWKKLPKRAIIVALDNVADPGNVGTILRTCDWFGVDGVLLSKNTVDLFNPKVVRGTMGAIFHLPIISNVDFGFMIQDSRQYGFKVITTVLNGGEPLNRFLFPERSIIIIGNEARGVSQVVQEYAEKSVTITKYGEAESLNAAISCGIILNALRANNV